MGGIMRGLLPLGLLGPSFRSGSTLHMPSEVLHQQNTDDNDLGDDAPHNTMTSLLSASGHCLLLPDQDESDLLRSLGWLL